MSPDTLPLALLTVAAELAIGGLWVLLFTQARNNAAASYVKFNAAMVFLVAAGAFALSVAVGVGPEVDGYPLDDGWMSAVRGLLAAVFGGSAIYAYATLRDHRPVALACGAVTSVLGLAALGGLAQVMAGPTWSYALTLASLVLGALVIGAVSNAMVLGHWYLVTPRLSEAPLREQTGALVAFMVLQAVLVGVALVLPHDDVDTSVEEEILANMFFWLRAGLGLAFPAVLAWMAFDSSGVRAMQSATGLLYIAMVLVFCGELAAKALLLGTAVPN